MSYDIIPITIDNLSLAENSIDFKVTNAYNLIDTPGNYNVVIDKITLPIMNVPISLNERFEIWFDSIDKGKHPSRFSGGDTQKIIFTETFYSPHDFAEKLNKFFKDVLEEYNFIEFTFDNETQLFTYHETVENKKYMKVFIPVNLNDIIVNSAVSTTPIEPIPNEGFFYELSGSKAADSEYYQLNNGVENLFTLEKFKIYTDLPIAPHYSYDMTTKALKVERTLSDIDYNGLSMIGNTTIKYLPTVLREFSLVHSSPVNNFSIWFAAYYSNGQEEYIKTKRNRYCSINLRFIKKNTLNNDNSLQ